MNIDQNKKPNVLILLPEDGTGGAERVFWNQVQSFSRFANITPCLYLKPAENSKNAEKFNAVFLDDRNNLSGSAITRFLRRAFALNRIIKKYQIEIVISHMDGANWLNIASLHHARTVLVVHGTVDHDQNISKRLQFVRHKFIFPILYNLATVTVAVSEAIKSELQSHGLRNVIHIPNSFNIKNIRALSNDALPGNLKEFAKDHYLLVASGRFAPQKNFEALIDIFHRIKEHGVRVKMIILGTGALQKTLEKKCDYLNITYIVGNELSRSDTAEIIFPGYCENPFPIVKKADLFLMPSKWEGYPLALCEAMICGTYPMSADCPTGPREIISPGSPLGQYDISEPEQTAYGTLLPIPVNDSQKDLWATQICNFLLEASQSERTKVSEEEHILQLDQNKIEAKWHNLLIREDIKKTLS